METKKENKGKNLVTDICFVFDNILSKNLDIAFIGFYILYFIISNLINKINMSAELIVGILLTTIIFIYIFCGPLQALIKILIKIIMKNFFNENYIYMRDNIVYRTKEKIQKTSELDEEDRNMLKTL